MQTGEFSIDNVEESWCNLKRNFFLVAEDVLRRKIRNAVKQKRFKLGRKKEAVCRSILYLGKGIVNVK